LLTGQRPGEVTHMRKEHVVAGWWTMPGAADKATGWPGTKNHQTHRVWLPEEARNIFAEMTAETEAEGFVFTTEGDKVVTDLPGVRKGVRPHLRCKEKVPPHDPRRTHGTTITACGFTRDAMNRIQNHREGGIADVYDRHEYAEENRRVMEAVASHVLELAEGRKAASNVIAIRQ